MNGRLGLARRSIIAPLLEVSAQSPLRKKCAEHHHAEQLDFEIDKDKIWKWRYFVKSSCSWLWSELVSRRSSLAKIYLPYVLHATGSSKVTWFHKYTGIQSREAVVSAKVFGKDILSFGILRRFLRRSISFSTLLAMLGYLAQLTSPPALLLKRQHHQRLILQSSFLYTRYIRIYISHSVIIMIIYVW